jgi:hypothetical protein
VPGIVVGEVSSAANPLLPFFYQVNGFLTDVYAVTYEVFALHKPADYATAVASGSGTKISTGYYVAPVDPSTSSLKAGPHEIVWSYTVAQGDTVQKTSYQFEVLSELYFRRGHAYQAYGSSSASYMSKKPVQDRQSAMFCAAQEIDRVTQGFFFPKYMTMRVQMRPASSTIFLMQPVIALASIEVISAAVGSTVDTEYEMDDDHFRIYNRHLEGLVAPDDRQNPKIAFAGSGGKFPRGNMNIKVTGVFGYTDSDGGPFGRVPAILEEVTEALAKRRLGLGANAKADPFAGHPGRIKSAKTRSQAVSFDTSLSGKATITGNPRLDEALQAMSRPYHVGVAG